MLFSPYRIFDKPRTGSYTDLIWRCDGLLQGGKNV